MLLLVVVEIRTGCFDNDVGDEFDTENTNRFDTLFNNNKIEGKYEEEEEEMEDWKDEGIILLE